MADTESEDQELQMKKAGACQVSMQGCPENKGETDLKIFKHSYNIFTNYKDLTQKVQEMTMMMTTQTRNSVEVINSENKCVLLFGFEIY